MNQYANSLLNKRDDDSFLKQSIQVVFGAGLLYICLLYTSRCV